jgi:hypothetical protein
VYPLGLIAVVLLMVISLLQFLLPSPFSWGGVIFVIHEDFVLVFAARVPEYEESFSKLNENF